MRLWICLIQTLLASRRVSARRAYSTKLFLTTNGSVTQSPPSPLLTRGPLNKNKIVFSSAGQSGPSGMPKRKVDQLRRRALLVLFEDWHNMICIEQKVILLSNLVVRKPQQPRISL